jgi:hypothetical protein
MTRKNYVAMAELIKTEVDNAMSPQQVEGMKAIVSALATALKRDNQSFDRTRFLTACGL